MSFFLSDVGQFFAKYPASEYIFRVMLASFCGIIVGLERTKRSKEAGIRTHCIIACASALIMIISKYGFTDMIGHVADGTRGADPARIAAQVISGISFLGAGVIIKNGNTVKGLTTAAGIWATAAIGLSCGAGLYSIALFVTFLIIVVQLIMHKFNVGNDAYSLSEIRLTIEDTPEIREVLLQKQKELKMEILSSKVSAKEDNQLSLTLSVKMRNSIPLEEAVEFMDEHPEIKSISV